MVRVRYAPSPTGSLHIGGARTALFNFLFARHHRGAFILRIEDTDRQRFLPQAEATILHGLRVLGLSWDEGPDVGGAFGPYRQFERLSLYQAAAERLLAAGAAYRCFCTPEELERERQERRRAGLPPRYSGRCRALDPETARRRAQSAPYTLRLQVPADGITAVDDLIRGRVQFDNAVLDDFVIMKADGTPTYNFAVVVDDHAMAISHVLRGEEHLSNTPKQLLVYRALEWTPPQWAHVPMILAPDKTKLSKRHGATAVEEYLAAGILPEALVNYLMLLGWSFPDGREIFSLAEAVPVFDLGRIQRTAAIYDQKKLEWMNGQYLRQLPLERLREPLHPYLQRQGLPAADPATLDRVVGLMRERARTLDELAQWVAMVFLPPAGYEPKGVEKYFDEPTAADRLQQVGEHLAAVEPWDADHLAAAFDRLAAVSGEPRARFMHPTRLAVSGRTVGPGLFELLAVVGREETVRRLRAAVSYLRGRPAAGGG